MLYTFAVSATEHLLALQTKSRTHEVAIPAGANAPVGTQQQEERDVPRSIVAKANKVR